MSEEHGMVTPEKVQGKHFKDMGMLDLRHVKSVEEMSGIASIHDVGIILVAEDMIGALTKVDIHDVGGIMPIPVGGKVNCLTGQTRLTGESFEGGDPETTLVLVGQTFVTTPVKSVGYKELRICGQFFAPRGSESAIVPKIAQLTGQNFFMPPDPKFIMGEETIGAEYLELLPKPTALVVMGQVAFASEISRDLLMAKIEEIVLMGEIRGPKHLIPALQVLTKEKMGEIRPYDA